ncbi:DUF6708 domain-containing protein, partial [Xanthomonas translucens]
MFTGWSRPFRVDRPLEEGEKSSALLRDMQENTIPSQRLGLININSSYIDWVDRRFLYRGMLNTSFVSIGAIGFIGIALFLCFEYFFGDFTEGAKWGLKFLVPFALLCGAVLYWALPRYEFFKFIYYPIRFNRKTRKVYVFREERDGGLLIVPWDKVFFHIGCGTDMKFL